MKRQTLASAFVIGFLLASAARAEEPVVIELWPSGKVPGETASVGEESLAGNKGGRRLTNVSKPTITVYRPDKDKNTGAAVVVAPGGGYSMLAWDHEGEDVVAWLNSIGVTGVLLKYRVPRRPDQPRDGLKFGPHQDAQRALGIVRNKAKEWGIDPNRIGMLGFSAGGHLTALTSTNFSERGYEPVDDADRASCRPDFAVIVYPGGALDRTTGQLVPSIHFTKECPPCFFVHASDDRGSSENSILMYLQLKQAGVPAEMHIYATGGHGFGMRPSKNPCAQWPKRCEEWMRSQGILEPAPKA